MLPPLKFRPTLLRKPWGGDGLWRVLGKGGPKDADMGESWELSDRPETPSTVAEGPWTGTPLRELVEKYPRDLLGAAFQEDGFPLLYKFICAREKLSVQVHPGPGSPGEPKTECWVVIDAVPSAELIIGVKTGGRSRTETLELLKSPRCEEVLRCWPARRGDVFFIPPGTVHAITEGLLLYEVQRNSDTTYRLYDWDRKDAQGKGRPLHLAEAAAVADLEERDGYKISPLRLELADHCEDYLVACPYFALVKWHRFHGHARLETHGRFRVLSVTAGSFVMISDSGGLARLSLGETALIPACMESIHLEAASEGAEAIVSFVPDLEAEIRAPLRKAGHGEAAISALFGPSDFQH